MSKPVIEWATHLPLLVRMFDKTEGDVLELGMGYFSTMILKWLCEMSGRTLYSYESNKEWYGKVAKEIPRENVYLHAGIFNRSSGRQRF